LIGEARWRRLRCHEGQFEVIDDPVHYGLVGKEGDDLHRAPALGTEHRVNFINLADHLGPALGRAGL